MMWTYGFDDGWSWIWMSGMMIVFWAGVILLAVWAIRTLASSHGLADSALETLRHRLADGEISTEEFEKTRKALGA